MRIRAVIAACLAFSLLAAFVWLQMKNGDVVVENVIPVRRDAGYVSSQACIACHPDQHASWYASYHRTMTQPATPTAVVAPFHDVQLETAGQTARLRRRGDEFWVNMVDPSWEKNKFAEWAQSRNTGAPDPFEQATEPPRIDAQVVMTTGSHHFQAYWVRGEKGRELWQFPWRYHIGEQRWVHRKDVFLAPPEWRPGMWFRTWNNQCIYCHSTGPYPGEDPHTGALENTQAAELGIACEACHGPGEQHLAFHSEDPTIRKPADDPIVNPARLAGKLSSQVCGSCHAHFQHEDPKLAIDGPQYRPGKNLFHFGTLELPENDSGVMSRFWGDGTNRSGGREYSGMSSSACYLRGGLSCTNCHSMHSSDANDQLKPEALSGEVCLQCHNEYRDLQSLQNHTHHAADSSGSECYNCHMPHTNYALFKAIRSHTIDSPRVRSLQSNSRPNACNLCHLDQTLAWTADHLESWHGISRPELNADDATIAAGILWALRGDAGQRVIAAWHFGWSPARHVSGSDWMTPTVLELMKDPYAAIRWVAFAALRTDQRFANAQFDFDEQQSVRDAAVSLLWDRWRAKKPNVSPKLTPSRLLLNEDGSIDEARKQELLDRRDRRPVAGVE